MKSILIACIFVFVLVFTKVDGVPQPHNEGSEALEPFTEIQEEYGKRDPDFIIPGNPTDIGSDIPQNEFGELSPNFTIPSSFTDIRNNIPQNETAVNKSVLHPTENSIFGTLNLVLSGIGTVYNEILSRQQAFVNILTCGNCINDGWNSILEVAMKVPELSWINQPDNREGGHFFTAYHQNGNIVGIGGIIVNNKPIPQYTFNKEGLAQEIEKKIIG